MSEIESVRASDRRVVVTGVAGMVGSHVAERLIHRGDQVVGVDNYLTGEPRNVDWLQRHPRFEFLHADVAHRFVVDGQVDAVLHLASPASPKYFRTMPIEILRVGSTGTLLALELAAAKDATLLYASSSEVYGDPEVHPQHENYTGNVALSGERACYDESKRFGEAAVNTYGRSLGLRTRVARIFNTYGPRMRPDDGRVMPNFLLQALRGEPLTIYGDGTQTRSFCFVDDLARGLLALLDSEVSDPVNLGSTSEVQIVELAELVLEVTGSTAGIVSEPLPPRDPVRRRPDTTRAQELLGWRPEIGLEEGLQRTLRYLETTESPHSLA